MPSRPVVLLAAVVIGKSFLSKGALFTGTPPSLGVLLVQIMVVVDSMSGWIGYRA